MIAINEQRKVISGLADTDLIWGNLELTRPITKEVLENWNFEMPRRTVEGIIEPVEEAILMDLCSFAANLIAYYKSDNADLVLIQARKKKDKRKRKPVIWMMGGRFRVKGKIDEPSKKKVKGGWKLSYRFWVRGHWRNQPYGPERSLRKLIWIEPFQKGPDFAEQIHRKEQNGN
jgi:hypothetical protein